MKLAASAYLHYWAIVVHTRTICHKCHDISQVFLSNCNACNRIIRCGTGWRSLQTPPQASGLPWRQRHSLRWCWPSPLFPLCPLDEATTAIWRRCYGHGSVFVICPAARYRAALRRACAHGYGVCRGDRRILFEHRHKRPICRGREGIALRRCFSCCCPLSTWRSDSLFCCRCYLPRLFFISVLPPGHRAALRRVCAHGYGGVAVTGASSSNTATSARSAVAEKV